MHGGTELPPISVLFRALSDPTRLAVYNCIRCCGFGCGYDTETGKCCGGAECDCRAEGATDAEGWVCGAEEGVTACRIRCQVPCAPSTLSHHLNELRAAGLIDTEKRGRVVYCRVLPEPLARIGAFISGK